MESFSFNLARELTFRFAVYVVAWGRSQRTLPWFAERILGEFMRLRCRHAPVSLIYFGDALAALAAPLARIAFPGVPVVATVHGLDVTYQLAAYQSAISRILPTLDRVICVSTATQAECLRRGVSLSQTVVVPHGVAVPEATGSPETVRWAARTVLADRLGFDLGDRPVVLTVGRLIKRKGVAWFVAEVLPSLIEQHPTLMFVVAGNGPERDQILANARAHGVEQSCLILGRVDDAIRDLLYRAADVFVMPNVPVANDIEGFGLVALEASATGLWVIAARQDGIPEAIIDQENGLLLPPRDTCAWYSVLGSTLSDRRQCWDAGYSGQRYTLARYSWPATADRYASEFQKLLQRE